MPAQSLTSQLIAEHLVAGSPTAGTEIALRIDQTLTQDATGTLVMQQFAQLGLPRVLTAVSAQYVDHNLLQVDHRNADDHAFLRSACRRFGVWFSRPGNGVSHPVHMQRLGQPGATLLGSDSHTPAAGALGMLAIGAGGLDVALAMAGRPFHLHMPHVRRVVLTGQLPPWVSAKDVVLELLRRHGVRDGVGWIFEYAGDGLAQLDAMDRHVIANMGAEMGATSSVFPADAAVRAFLERQGRGEAFTERTADPSASYDAEEVVVLDQLEPLIACPSSPGNVVPVRTVAGREIHQAYIGSSANPGLRDLVVPALMVRGRHIDPAVSFDINPSTRQMLGELSRGGWLDDLISAGARIHQAGCNGCIGMGQAPATGRNSLRTVPRNFPGRSGTIEDAVYLCSPETATASALRGVITDPRDLGPAPPRFKPPAPLTADDALLEAPPADGTAVIIERGPNIVDPPSLDVLPAVLTAPVLLVAGDDVSTDEILPAGAEVLPLRSNIPAISRYAFARVDDGAAARAMARDRAPSVVVAGANYGQGSSREHAALAPRYLGVRAVLAVSYARIHAQNLINFGILPLRFADPSQHQALAADDELVFPELRQRLDAGEDIVAERQSDGLVIALTHNLSRDQIRAILAGGMINLVRDELGIGSN
ncbi:MAG: aconitate hydratase [Planctomycetota bacterium]|jgi:aconitate hydratase|nr:aconitate hydratase [Planctomycetota bacterium]